LSSYLIRSCTDLFVYKDSGAILYVDEIPLVEEEEEEEEVVVEKEAQEWEE